MSRNLGIAAPSGVAVSGESGRLCIAVIVPFLRIQSVEIPGSRTMAVPSRLTAKPDGPFAYTNISGAIVFPSTVSSITPTSCHMEFGAFMASIVFAGSFTAMATL